MTIKVYQNAKLRQKSGLYDIVVKDGRFEEISAGASEKYLMAEKIDLGGKLVCEPYVESHIHLDYVNTAVISGSKESEKTLFGAINEWSDAKAVLTKDTIKGRAREAVKGQVYSGVQYIRTHVDVTDSKLTAFQAISELKEELRDMVTIQIIAFPQEGYYSYEGGEGLVEQAVKMGADVVGGIPHFEFTREEGVASVKKAFEIAMKYDKLLDIHCDETDDEQSRFSEIIASEAYHTGMRERATASHTCAMGSYNNAYAYKMMSKYQKSGMNFISCPTENCYLQGRYDGYPRRRGLTRIDELEKNGINVSFGQDSISDPWYPLGNGNLMNQVDFGLHLGHIMEAEQINHGLDYITKNGAKTLHLGESYEMKKGNPASFVVLDSSSEFEAIRNRAGILRSVRNGKELVVKEPEKVVTGCFEHS